MDEDANEDDDENEDDKTADDHSGDDSSIIVCGDMQNTFISNTIVSARKINSD